jgi:hypothetical protein
MARQPKKVEPLKGVFLRGDVYWCRVRAPGREPTRRSLGAKIGEEQLANDRYLMLDTLLQQREYDLLEAVIDGTLEIADLHAKFLGKKLEEARADVGDMERRALRREVAARDGARRGAERRHAQ